MESMHTCDVSVIITAYNQSAPLELLLSHLVRQEYMGSWEIIICDDGSDEDTLSVIKAASRRFSGRMRYVWQSRNGWGLARSRNNALRCANGDVLLLMDADLAVPPDFVSRHAGRHCDGKRRLVCGSRRWLFLGDLPRGVPLASLVPVLFTSAAGMSALYSEVHYQKKYASSPYPWFACLGCNFSFSRDDRPLLFDEVFNGWGGEDSEFACRLQSRHGYEISLEPDLVGLHLQEGHRRFTVVKPTSHDQIVQFLRNMVYFHDSYPELDSSCPAFQSFGFFELDAESNGWRRAATPSLSRERIHSVFTTAQRWLTDRGLRQPARRVTGSGIRIS